MSVQPGQHNISVQRRADYDLSLQFKDSTGANINLTGSLESDTGINCHSTVVLDC